MSREFQTAASERTQVHLCYKWARTEFPGKVSYQNLADFFNVGKSTIEYHLSRPFDDFDGAEQGRIGRPSIFSDEELVDVKTFITERFEDRVPCTYDAVFQEE